MRELVEIVLALIDLIKAELEQSKRAVFNLAIALSLAVAGVALLACATGLTLCAVYLALLSAFDQKWAVFVTGLGAFGCAGVLLWIAAYKARH